MSVATKAARAPSRRRGAPSPGGGPRLTEARATLRARDDGALKLAIVADTHSRPHPGSLEILAKLAPDAIVHAGDIGDLAVLDALRAVAPVIAVRGNIDGHAPDLPDVVTIDVEGAAGALVLRLLLTHIAVYGPKLRAEVARLAEARGAQVVLCGHSHVPFIGRDKGLLVFNAGSVGPRRFQLPIVFGVLEWSERGLSLRHVNAETGERWEPPR